MDTDFVRQNHPIWKYGENWMYTLIYDYSTILVWKHPPLLKDQYCSTSLGRGGALA